MTKRTLPLIVGNWKATPAKKEDAVKFIKTLDRKLANSKVKLPKRPYYLAVADIFIPHLQGTAAGFIGSQNISGVAMGQETGTVVPSQLLSGGAEFVIVGHSEVRARGETADDRAHKVALALQSKVMTVLCVGERQRDTSGNYLSEIEEDVKQSLSLCQKNLLENLVIAYEPVWAVGAATSATPQECFEVVIALRRALASLVGIDYAKKVHMLYGGTVTKENARLFLNEGGVDGLLIGRASQEVDDFYTIILNCAKK